MKPITSVQNDTFKSIKRVATSSKYRSRTNQTLLEGIHLCESYLQSNQRPLTVIFSQSALHNPEVNKIIVECDKLDVPSILLEDTNFRVISSVENGVGLLFQINTPRPDSATMVSDNSLLLENVQDPGNMGAILRTAAAAGIDTVFTSEDCVSAWSPKVLRAGMGAHFALTVHEGLDLVELISTSRITILATSLHATASLYEQNLSEPTAWLFGNEGQGVTERLLALSSRQIIIPQNSVIESLNVAAAVAVCLFEQRRQRNI